MMRKILLGLLLATFAGSVQAQNYSATAGSGLTFGAKSVASVLYPQIVFCDPTTPSQCVAVNSSGQMTIANTSFAVTNTGTFATQSAITAATSAAADGWDLTQGAQANSVCGTSTGTCSLISLIKYLNTQAASIATNTGAPIPAGTNAIGSITNTSFAVTNAGTFAIQNTAATPAGTNNIGSVNAASNVTQNDCSGTVTTGGTAVNAFTAQTTLHGFTIFNYDTGHNDEVLWISFTTTAAASTAGSYPLPAPTATTFAGGGSFTSPPGMGTNHALSVVAATSGHAFSCTWW